MNEVKAVKDFGNNTFYGFLWPFVIIVYWLSTSLLHLEFSKIIIAPVSTPLGEFTPSHFSFHLGWALLILLAFFVFFQAISGKTRLRTLFYWTLWGAALYGTNRYLVFSTNEYAHYPQYALLAVLLVCWRDPRRDKWPIGNLIFWGTALGIIDEVIQYLFVCPSYGDYLDFNDFLLNELGIVAGLFLAYGFRIQPAAIKPLTPIYKTRAFKCLILSSAFILLLVLAGRLKISPPQNIPPGGIFAVQGTKALYIERRPGITGAWNHAGGNRVYYVLSPSAGLSLLLVLGLVFSSFDPRVSNFTLGFRSVSSL